MTSTPPSVLTIGGYLCERLRQLSVDTILGVPGDFNLKFLTRLREGGFRWVGTANELNGAYAADGFARAAGRPAVLVTTFGVGELSAANGLAGSTAEKVPVIHIVGTPATFKQSQGLLLHHSLGDHHFNTFSEIAKHITGAHLDLYTLWNEGRIPQLDPANHLEQVAGGEDVGRELDRVLEYVLRASKPVYIAVPQDLVDVPVSPAVEKRLSVPLNGKLPPNDENVERFVLDEIVRRVLAASAPIVVGDICAGRHGLEPKVRDFVTSSGLPYFAAPMGRGVVDEVGNPQFGGVYSGALSRPEVTDASDIKADLAISLGGLWSDLNTGGFTARVGKGTGGSRAATIELHTHETVIGYAHYAVGMDGLLPKLTAVLAQHKDKLLAQGLAQIAPCQAAREAPCQAAREAQRLPSIDEAIATLTPESLAVLGGAERVRTQRLLTNAWWWPRFSHFLHEGDCLLGETGNSAFALMDVPLPPRAQWISQVLWGSIGYGGGGVLGAALAHEEKAKLTGGPKERTVLVIGDGAWQLTVQELGTVIREGLTPLIFVINNDGYQIEREIWGPNERYNDITAYNYEAILRAFQPPEGYTAPASASHAHDPKQAPTAYYAIRTQDDADRLLSDPDFARAEKCTLVEVFLPRGDGPPSVRRLGL